MEEEKITALIKFDKHLAKSVPEAIGYIKRDLSRKILDALDERLLNGEFAIKVEKCKMQELPREMLTEARQEATLTEIIRCKNCNYACHDEDCKTWWCGIYRCETASFGFCHLGEKKEE